MLAYWGDMAELKIKEELVVLGHPRRHKNEYCSYPQDLTYLLVVEKSGAPGCQDTLILGL
jgi:hypothetical protein